MWIDYRTQEDETMDDSYYGLCAEIAGWIGYTPRTTRSYQGDAETLDREKRRNNRGILNGEW